ncbi:tRNA uridine-5-carboxymethylaminomethyl(34) synthesis GTPase MnmE [Paracoccus caeni]|uniref:tRNA modification GTPase MnmE n=1 Tax=Paracoccus caeni TaxID=657651 RepID=A0A934W134_9RHOB|nr:tRNA uridine-5-carboxymethylaminomethyl(34) synthesis GTPase MnmE [Paracoccus caeni]MBK4217575.1 tRNA uridine-5-carboxymethylaminomethyl(34) synthesis GTPase MnmE [Paracoccus caeni]
MDVIFAEATPPGRGGVSIIRLSGSGSKAAVENLTGALPEARRAYLRDLRDGDDVLDQALVIWFSHESSFTGEEVVELHLHGAPVIVRRVMMLLGESGLRLADAGEFTRRAFLNGRMDLAEVEGLGDLLEAETEAQRRLALRLAGGELGRHAERWRGLLIRAGALVESSVDFADEDVPEDVPVEVHELLDVLRRELDSQIAGYAAAESVRRGFEIAIIGPPNSGKSSFINRVARREVAIVSDVAGTTRDVIELRIDLKGLPVTFLDTAGLRESDDRIERMGVDRAKQRAISADLRLHLSSTGSRDEGLWETGDILVRTMADLSSEHGDVSISNTTGIGIDDLLDLIHQVLSKRVAIAGIVSHERQLLSLMDARNALHRTEDVEPELLAESIRTAASSLDRLLGRIGAEEYLDVIFSSFCIGK